MWIVESRDKCSILDLKLLFTIVDCFSRRFPPRFFTVKLVCFIGFPGLSYLVLFIFPLHDIDVCLFLQVLFIINLINNLGLKHVNSINRGLNFSTGVIRWFQLLLGVFINFWKLGWILLSYNCLLLFFSILVNVLYCDVDNCVVVDFWVGASGWIAWCYKTVYIHIESVYYFMKIWMDIVKLYLLINFWTSILVSIIYLWLW